MLKGLHGVTSHEHRERIPILENDQDMARLTASSATRCREQGRARLPAPQARLYTWGDTLAEAERHVEILEFLFENDRTNVSSHGADTNPRRKPTLRTDDDIHAFLPSGH